MSNFPKTIILADGRKVTINRKPKVKDMKQIRRSLFGDEAKDEFNLTLHMIARVCEIDGAQATVEAIEELDLDELPKLTDAIFEGNVPTAPSPILT